MDKVQVLKVALEQFPAFCHCDEEQRTAMTLLMVDYQNSREESMRGKVLVRPIWDDDSIRPEKVPAIKLWRMITGDDLRDSKNAVEERRWMEILKIDLDMAKKYARDCGVGLEVQQ